MMYRIAAFRYSIAVTDIERFTYSNYRKRVQ